MWSADCPVKLIEKTVKVSITFHLGTDQVDNKMATFCHDEHQKVESKTSSLTVVLRTFEQNEIYGIHGKYYSGKFITLYRTMLCMLDSIVKFYKKP